ncbi:MAG: excinuclease ABC subunit UvrC [Actinobacteria bacterium]|uniref:Unannotated protein n=1 Tax=freshwater metagenome TaxID=449393 RepID=A0A6J6NNG5_9ZZZZ|nr:excinuclease ABC subunit UvrC [Actinomycetota bacterium]
MTPEERPRTSEIPEEPGVYRFRNDQGRVIYVGKAKNLRARLTSYFQENLHERTARMVQEATSVDWTIVATEVDALQLEWTWIKSEDPKYNVRFKDDKSYPYLAITTGESIPRVFVARAPKKKGVRYLGPFPNAGALRLVVDQVLRTFPVRTCAPGVLRQAVASGRPCLLGHIEKCSAPCVNQVTVEEHKQKISEFISFFSRDPAPYIRRVQKEMESAAAAEEFERAAKLRDDLIALELALETSTVVLPDDTDADFISLVEGEIEIGATIFSVRHGRIRGQRSVVMERDFDKSSADLYRQLVQDVYSDLTQEIPREICMPQLPEGAKDLQEWLAISRNEKTSFKVPQRGDKVSLLEIVTRNASEALLRHQLLRSSDISKRAQALSELQDALALQVAPLRIECYDISHIQGTHAVGSMVVFEDGAPRKSEYRRFEIREGGGDDLASMSEVLTRRLRRLKDEESVDRAEEIAAGLQARRFSYRPQLIVVDGGRTQVDAAAKILEREGFGDIALVGLAKRLEEIWKPADARPVILPRKSESLFLLQRLRDESHRFAITYHRSKRGRAMIESLLDEIPGLGEGRRAALLENFTSMKALRLASEAEISQVPGVGPAIAARIVAWFAAESARGETQAVDMGTGEILS